MTDNNKIRKAVLFFVSAFIIVLTSFISITGVLALTLQIVSVALFSHLLFSYKKYFVFPVVLISFLVTFLFTQNPVYAVISVLYVIPASAYFLSFKVTASNTVKVIVLTVSYTVSLALALCGFLYNSFGSVSEGFNILLNSARSDIAAFVPQLVSYYNGLLSNMNISASISEDIIYSYISFFKMSMPGLAVLFIQLLAMATTLLFKWCDKLSGNRVQKTFPLSFTVSVPTSIIFLLSFFISLFLSANSIPYFTAQNLLYILMPVLVVFGITAMFGKRSRFRTSKRKFNKVITIVFCAILMYFSPSFLLTYLALWGAFSSIGQSIREYVEKHNNEGGE